MHNGLSHLPSQEITFPHSANDTALRLALEGVRRLAAQSRLLALNSAFEAAGASREAEAAEEMNALGGSAAQAIAEAEKMVATVELLLQQMQSAPCKTGTL
ncbi:MAG: hypothetical protein IPG33_10660 [Betaproteobacteria bacterium]|jgi:hypothetical protein|nr:hypothetical protein [Betaproteobacteria bacterium]